MTALASREDENVTGYPCVDEDDELEGAVDVRDKNKHHATLSYLQLQEFNPNCLWSPCGTSLHAHGIGVRATMGIMRTTARAATRPSSYSPLSSS